jgi:hypothetical protein
MREWFKTFASLAKAWICRVLGNCVHDATVPLEFASRNGAFFLDYRIHAILEFVFR